MINEKWWHSSVVYQIYPKSFYDSNQDGIGDIQGIIEKIPYLKKLGIDVIWLNPIYKSPQVDNGYDISDYYDIHYEFGSMKDFEKLISECKLQGIKIILDLVVNHTSDQHQWFKEAKKSIDNPFHNYYIWSEKPNNLQSNFGGSAWEYVPEVNKYYLHFYAKEQPDLNWENKEMRSAIYEMMNFWIDKGISGFRMDVIDLIGKEPLSYIKENGPKLHEYLQEMSRETFRGKDLLTVGETWGATPENSVLYSNPERNELSMVFQFEQINLDKIPGKQRWDVKPLELIDLKRVLSKWQVTLNETGWNSLFWNNHDLPRIVSRWGDDTDEFRELSAKMLAILLHGMKGTPYIYQGEEIGMTNLKSNNIDDFVDIETQNIIKERLRNGQDKESLLKAIQLKARDNGRTPLQWNNSKYAGFSTVPPWMSVNQNFELINIDQNLKDKNSIFYTYQKLIQIRKDEKIIRFGTYELIDENHPSVFAYTRKLKDETVYVICNFYKEKTEFECQVNNFELLISNYNDLQIEKQKITLRPFESFIIKTKENQHEA
ncbi:glycoside hydrolase family 13 protein [Macrococcus animalis]|uniref:glycoside hydrolase family 13 protein n=1 Tax=Macrococcus animalis TaxID=3395467 RepID=UPI0039BE111F